MARSVIPRRENQRSVDQAVTTGRSHGHQARRGFEDAPDGIHGDGRRRQVAIRALEFDRQIWRAGDLNQIMVDLGL